MKAKNGTKEDFFFQVVEEEQEEENAEDEDGQGRVSQEEEEEEERSVEKEKKQIQKDITYENTSDAEAPVVEALFKSTLFGQTFGFTYEAKEPTEGC